MLFGLSGGDGFVNVGRIDATGLDVGAVKIAGDLGQIDAGNAETAKGYALKSLTVQSLGEFGTATQAAGGDLISNINGALGTLTVKGNLRDAQIEVSAATALDAKIARVVLGGSLIGGIAENSGDIHATGAIGSVTIGGSIVGGAGNESGSLFSNERIGAVKIKSDLLGGAGERSGRIVAADYDLYTGELASLTVGGSIVGGGGELSGAVDVLDKIGAVKVGADLLGGAGKYSGYISTSSSIASTTIGGSVTQGSGEGGAWINAGGPCQSIIIKGDLGGEITGYNIRSINVAGSMTLTGSIDLYPDSPDEVLSKTDINVRGDVLGWIQVGGTSLIAVKVGGSLIGGENGERFDPPFDYLPADGTISIDLYDLQERPITGSVVVIGHDIIGGSGDGTGNVSTSGGKRITVGGSIIGGSGFGSGSIDAGEGLAGSIRVGGDVRGGIGDFSRRITSALDLTSVAIGGSLVGCGGESSGSIAVYESNMKISGDVRGGKGDSSGSIGGDGNIRALSIGGSLLGGDGESSASISFGGSYFDSEITSVVEIQGSIRGGAGDSSARIYGDTFALKVLGSIVGGAGELSAEISASTLQSLTIGGDVIGTAARPVVIDAYDSIGKVTIAGHAQSVVIDCGGNYSYPFNPDAQIGAVTVGGNWIASSIAAGVESTNGFFGDKDDTKITSNNPFNPVLDYPDVASRIASITIKGRVSGTAGGADHFGFVAQEVGSLRIGGVLVPLAKGAANDDLFAVQPRFLPGATGDIRVHEVA